MFEFYFNVYKLPELVTSGGNIYHRQGPNIAIALLAASGSVLAFGMCRSFTCLILGALFSLIVGNYRYQVGQSPSTVLYIVVHFSYIDFSLKTSFLIKVKWSYFLDPPIDTLSAKFSSFWILESNVLLVYPQKQTQYFIRLKIKKITITLVRFCYFLSLSR